MLRVTNVPDSVIYPVNQTLKVASIAVGTFGFVRGEKGWLQGMASGVLFSMLSYLLFAAVSNDFALSYLVFAELFLCLAAGALCGILAVNLFSKA